MPRTAIQNANASLYFNGVAYADTASNSTLSLANGFTVAGWIKISKFITASTRQKMIATANWGFGATSTTQKLSFTTIGVKDYDSTGSTIQPGVWVFACAVLDASNDVTFYLNGVLDSVVTGTNPATTTAGVTSLGQRATPTDRHIGNLSGVRVFNRELTAQEILSLYNGTVPSGVIAEYKLNEGAGSIAYDTSGNGNHGTITAGTYTADVPTKKRELVGGNLVKNGDFEFAPPFTAATTTSVRWIDGTAAGSLTNNLFKWATFGIAGSATAMFDNAMGTSTSSSNTIKLSTLSVASNIEVSNVRIANAENVIFVVPVLPNTSYTATFLMKTVVNSGSSTTGANASFTERTAAGLFVKDNPSTPVVATTDWNKYSVIFTTSATTRYITPKLRVIGTDGAATLIMDAWFDDITLTKTTPETRTAAGTRTVATSRSVA